MEQTLSPLESEFATVEEAEAYDRWYRAKVQHSIDNPGKRSTHDEVMARTRTMLDRKKAEIAACAAN